MARESNTLDLWFANVFHEYFAAYHWSLQDDKEPDLSQVYNEPAPHDTEAVSLKVARINARKDVSLKAHSHLVRITHNADM